MKKSITCKLISYFCHAIVFPNFIDYNIDFTHTLCSIMKTKIYMYIHIYIYIHWTEHGMFAFATVPGLAHQTVTDQSIYHSSQLGCQSCMQWVKANSVGISYSSSLIKKIKTIMITTPG